MKVLLMTNFFHPEKTGIGVTATDCARFVRGLGHDVTVLTTLPYYPDWEVFPEYRGKFFSREELEGIPVLRTWLYVPKEPSTLKRILHEISPYCPFILSEFDLFGGGNLPAVGEI